MKTKNDKLPGHTLRDDSFNAARTLLADSSGILANIMMSMGDGLSIQDRNMRIVYQNKFMIDNFGPHMGEYCYTIYEKQSSACEGCPIIESYRTGQVTKALRVGITKDGLPFRFENIASVLRNGQGEIVAGIELCRIVEEREKALDELRETMESLKRTQDQLVRAEKLAGIGRLAAGVAHEINNPASFVLSNMSMMQKYVSGFFSHIDSMEKLVTGGGQENPEPAGIREKIRQIITSEEYCYLKNDLPQIVEESLNGLQRINTIVSGLLAFGLSKESGRGLVDVNAEIESALSLLDYEISKKGIVIRNFGNLPETWADSRQLRQMFTNLILNATQAIKADGLINITTGVKNSEISIEISDNGIGIPREDIQDIFNPFFTTREVGSGVGLGLSIVHRIIEGHNGRIDVKSEPGQGTVFTIRLPGVSCGSGMKRGY